LRAKVHSFIETKGKTFEERKEIKDQTRSIILSQLEKFNA